MNQIDVRSNERESAMTNTKKDRMEVREKIKKEKKIDTFKN